MYIPFWAITIRIPFLWPCLNLNVCYFSAWVKWKTKKAKTKARNTWTEEMLQEALHELDLVTGATIRGVAKKHGLEESAIRFQMRKIKANLALGKGGHKEFLFW